VVGVGKLTKNGTTLFEDNILHLPNEPRKTLKTHRPDRRSSDICRIRVAIFTKQVVNLVPETRP
jgi:hypothetical protein